MNFTKELQKNKLFLGLVVFVLCLGLVFTGQTITQASTDPANNGNDLASLASTEVSLVIGGEGITNGLGFQRNFYYLTKSDMDTIKADKSLIPDLLGGSAAWEDNVLYSSYDNHGTPNYIYRVVSGLNLKTAVTALGADVSKEALNLEAKATDGYVKVIFDAFGVDSPRNYYAPDGTVGSDVYPSLAFYETKVSTSAPDADTEVPTEAGTTAKEYPLFVFGQTAADDHTGCSFIKNTIKIRLGADSPAFSLTVGDTTKTISLSDLALLGVYDTSYSYSKNSVIYTHNLKGIPLDKLLTYWNVTLGEGQTLTMNVNDGAGVYAYTSRTIAPEEVSKCFLAYRAVGSDGSIVDNDTPLRLYCPGEFGNAVLVKNVVGATDGQASSVAYTVYNYQTKSRDTDPDIPVPNAPWDSKTFYGDVGSQVTVNAVEIPGRVAVEALQTITLDADSNKNTVIFRYGVNAGLLIAGNGLNKDIYYSPAELKALADDSGNLTRYYSGMKKGGIPSVIVGRGVDLLSMLNGAGITATQGQITIKTTASDGYGSSLKYDLTNSKFVPQGYYFPDIFNAAEDGKTAVDPMLAFYRLDYDKESGATAPTVPTENKLPALTAWEPATDFPHPTIMIGQSSVGEFNVMNFAKMIFAVEVDAPQVLQVDWLDGNTPKNKKATLANIIIKGLESCEVKGTTYQGIKLNRLLTAGSIPVAADEQIQALDKSGQVLAAIAAGNQGNYLVAININDTQIDRTNPISLVDLNTGAVRELSRLNIFVPTLENTASHLSYLDSTDNIEKNYAKGDYLYSTLTVTGSAIGEEQIYTVKDLEEYAADNSLGLGYENTYSSLGKGDVFTKQTMSGLKLYDFLVNICKMNNSSGDDLPVVFVSRDNYKVTSTIGEVKALYNSYNAQGDSTPLAQNLPVLLSYGANGKPLVGAVGAQSITYQPTEAEGYDAAANNGGGPLKLTIGQNDSSERNANKNAKQVVKIIIGDDIKYNQHNYEPYDGSDTFTVDIYDNEKLNEADGGLIKSQTFTISQLENLANDNADKLLGNYYLSADFYEGINLWWLLSEQVGLPSLDGTVKFGTADNSYDATSKTVDLAYLRNFDSDYTDYTSTQDTLTLTGVKPALAFAVNGYPLVKNSSDGGYVAENKAGKTVNNASGPLVAALPSFVGTTSVTASNSACGGVKIYLNLPVDTHIGDTYGVYADNTLSISGKGVKNSKEYKLSELEAESSWIISSVQGDTTYKGISLLSLLTNSNIGLRFDAENIIVKSATSQKIISAADLRAAGSAILLAYSKNAAPLVPDASSVGFVADNTGGPLYLVNSTNGLEQVTAIEVTVKQGIWQHKNDALYQQYLDSTIEIRGSEVEEPKTFTLSQIEEMTDAIVRDYFASGGDSNGGYEGVKLSYLLERAGVTKTDSVPSKITVIGSDGWKVTVPVNDVYDGIISNYQNGEHRDVILAYAKDGYPLVPSDQSAGYDAVAGNGYGPMRLIVENTISLWNKNVVAIVVGEDEVTPKAPGGDIANSVFYLAVNDGNGDTKYYYYTRAELEALETQEDYFYNDHSVKKTVTTKGALLSTLLENLEGVTITPDMIVQYAEEDGYHAAANETVPDSYYKDTVASLTEPTLWGDGSTKLPTRTIISYLIHEEYQNPDEFNVNDAPGVFKDADNNSGYLRAYRETGSGQDDDNIGSANSTVIKYLLGVVVSKDGKLLSGRDGCTVKSVSKKNDTISVRSDIIYKGLVPGMQYAVRAPQVTNANLAEGESAAQTITVGTGTKQTVTFKYTEDTYFFVKNKTTGAVKNYTYTDLVKIGVQVPEAGTVPYGYYKPMYYRYNGVYLNSLTGGISNISSVILVAKDGSRTTVAVADLDDYFVAYNNTQSKSSTNIPEGKRVTISYPDARVILPATGENITGADPADYTPAGKDVDVAVAAAEGIEIITTKNTGNTGNSGNSSGSYSDNSGSGSSGSGGTIMSKITSDNNGHIEAKVMADQIKSAVNNVGSGSVGIKVNASSTTESIACAIPQEAIETLVKGGSESLIISTPLANMTLDQDTLASLKNLADDITILMAEADRENLSTEAKNKIGDRPVYSFSVLAGSKTVTEFGGNISISLPYHLASWENTNNIVIFYLDSNGNPHLVNNCIYDADKGVITFVTKHFSAYAVGHSAYEFGDIQNHWAKDSIDFVTARELFLGTEEGIFSPNGTMTRGMLVTVLGRLYNVDAEAKVAFSDVSVAAYYAPYVAWAAENGIVKGIGNNQFAPNSNITREQLAVILDNYCSFIGAKFTSSGSHSSFADSNSISSWAISGVQNMQKAGIISGKGGNIFNAKGNATRAEVSTILQRFIRNSLSSMSQNIIEADDSSSGSSSRRSGGSSSIDDSEDDSPYLTVSGSKVAETVKFSLNEMKNMDLQTIIYTGRNKQYNNERQTIKIKGVALADILDEAGMKSGATTLKVICSDGYIKVYDLQSLLEDAYSYADSESGELVPTVVAIKEGGSYYDAGEGNPFRLVMGQADYDSDETKDFNMQNWAKYLEEIVID